MASFHTIVPQTGRPKANGEGNGIDDLLGSLFIEMGITLCKGFDEILDFARVDNCRLHKAVPSRGDELCMVSLNLDDMSSLK